MSNLSTDLILQKYFDFDDDIRIKNIQIIDSLSFINDLRNDCIDKYIFSSQLLGLDPYFYQFLKDLPAKAFYLHYLFGAICGSFRYFHRNELLQETLDFQEKTDLRLKSIWYDYLKEIRQLFLGKVRLITFLVKVPIDNFEYSDFAKLFDLVDILKTEFNLDYNKEEKKFFIDTNKHNS